jgi:flagellar basal body P-ring formation protein FlgA
MVFAGSATVAGADALQTPQELQRAAERLLGSRLNSTAGPVRTLITAGPVDPRLRLARCATPLEGVIPNSLRDTGRATVGVRCAQPAWTVYLPVTIESELAVLVLKQAAARNAALRPQDVESQTRRVPGVAANYLTDPAQLDRRHLRMPAAQGTTLTADLFAADVLIRRGQRVTLVASAGGIEVRAQGEAVADASAAGRVRVLNLSSRRIVEGQVESSDQVRVSL